MRRTLAALFISLIAACGLLFAPAARAADYLSAPAAYDRAPGGLLSTQQLEKLVAPIALYPDPLLAQVVVAATFLDQIDEAARFLRAGANPAAIDAQPWDVSVKAVAHYPTVLYMMADHLGWTTSLGQAYVQQSTAVMQAVQWLRARARSTGHLATTQQMEVVVKHGYVALWPVYPRALYVPVYDPALVFYRHRGYRAGVSIAFGGGFAIGAWLNYDVDWHRHRVYYHGWKARRGWVRHYRPHVHITNIYVGKHHAHVRLNHSVLKHKVHRRHLKRHHTVHHGGHGDRVHRRHGVARHGVRRHHLAPKIHHNVHKRHHRVGRHGVHGQQFRHKAHRDAHHKDRHHGIDAHAPSADHHRGRLSGQRSRWPISSTGVRHAPRRQHDGRQRDLRSAPRQRHIMPRAVWPIGRSRHDGAALGSHRSGAAPHVVRQRGRTHHLRMQRTRPATRSMAPRRHRAFQR